MKNIEIYINDKKTGKRKLVSALLLEDRSKTVLVRLLDGNEIVRRKDRDFPKEK